MDAINFFMKAVKKYGVFEGRAQRAEYWYFELVVLVLCILLGFIMGLFGMTDNQTATAVSILQIALLLPAIAVGTRRLHDINRTGWWQLLIFIPIIGWIVLLVFWVTNGNPGTNKYGANPKLNKA